MSDGPALARACLALLNELARQGQVYRAGRLTPDQANATTYVARTFPLLPERQLTQWLAAPPPKEDFKERWVHGPPAFGRAQPKVLTVAKMWWDFTGPERKMSLLVGLVPGPDVAPAGRPVPVTAFRYETGDGRHNFDHAQPTTRVRKQGAALPGASTDTVSEAAPAFPLDSGGPCGIVACAALSLLGSRNYADIFSQRTDVKKAVSPFLLHTPGRRLTAPLPAGAPSPGTQP